MENLSDYSRAENPILDLTGQNPGKRLCVYIGESDRWRGKPLDTALLETLRAIGLAGATVYRGVAGFGAHSHIRSASIEVLSTDLPVMVEVVDSPARIRKALDTITPMVREGLITLEDVTIVKYTHRYLNPLPADRLVGEVMTREIITLQPDMSVHTAWEKMINHALKAMPVVDEAGKVVGILTDEDLLQQAGIQQRLSLTLRMGDAELQKEMASLRASDLTVQEVMTQPVITITEMESLGLAAAKMVDAGLKRLPVVNAEGCLVGILSRLDVLRQVADTTSQVQPEPQKPGSARTVKELMSKDFPTVSVDDDLSLVVDQFVKWNTHRLIVLNEGGKAVGLISDSDVISRVLPEHRRGLLNALRNIGKPSPGKASAGEIMSKGVTTITPEQSIEQAAKLMLAEGRKWLVVIENEKPVGVVDRQLLLEALVP